jgi:hypothetical protein
MSIFNDSENPTTQTIISWKINVMDSINVINYNMIQLKGERDLMVNNSIDFTQEDIDEMNLIIDELENNIELLNGG